MLLIMAFLSFQAALSSDFDEALKHANHGNSIAQSNLGVMYENGLGVAQDYIEAVNWYRKAAEQGDSGAQSNLGSMYAMGSGVPEDRLKAYAWWSLAKSQGDRGAMQNMAALRHRISAKEIAIAKALAARC